MHEPTTQQEIAQLQKRLAQLNEQAEDELRLKLKEARAVVTDLEFQLSEITGRASASQIKAAKGFAHLSDEELEVQILFVVQKASDAGINGAEIARQLNQDALRIRKWIKEHPGKLRKEGAGAGTKYSSLQY